MIRNERHALNYSRYELQAHASGEIDLMKYYNNAPYFLNYDFERIVAENKDVLGLIWLAKINIK